MSNIAIKGAATGSGTFTLEAPATSTNRTLTLPDEAGTLATTAFVTNRLVQNLNVTTGAMATGTNLMPDDDTIPQITDGDQYMSLAITPTSTTSVIEVNVRFEHSHSASSDPGAALFRNDVADALACAYWSAAANIRTNKTISYYMISGTTAEIVFSFRMGGSATGTTTFNGVVGQRKYGGAMGSSITIKEYAA